MASNISASEITIAIASNLLGPIEEIAQVYNLKGKNQLKIVSGSTGKLYAQIINGAPFDLFISADQEHPKLLINSKLASEDKLYTFAVGKLVLWNNFDNLSVKDAKFLLDSRIKYISIANPDLAPYGKAAKEFLEKSKLWTKLENKLVRGENINQTYQFVESKNASAGFVALSQVINKIPQNSYWIIPQSDYKRLNHDLVVIKTSEQKKEIIDVYDFLKSLEVKAILTKYGYEVK